MIAAVYDAECDTKKSTVFLLQDLKLDSVQLYVWS